MKVTNKAICEWLAVKGIDLTPQFVGMVRRNERGSKYANKIHEAELAILEKQAHEVKRQLSATANAYGMTIN